jgi:D-alanyl-lipoteichoic acid acyltransferase DltB (MBOAT superfamily)
MTESELVRWQFWGLGFFFGVALPFLVGGVLMGWLCVRSALRRWRRFKRGVRGSDG